MWAIRKKGEREIDSASLRGDDQPGEGLACLGKRRGFISLLFLLLFPLTPHAQGADATLPEKLPILHEGRVKPLDSYARLQMNRLCGCDRLGGLDAKGWLAMQLFSPEAARDIPALEIAHPSLRSMLGLQDERSLPYYSYHEVTPLIGQQSELLRRLLVKDQNIFTATERAFWTLFENYAEIRQVTGTLALLRPHTMTAPDSVRRRFGWPESGVFTLLEMDGVIGRIRMALERVVEEKGADFESYSKEEQELAGFALQLHALQRETENNHLLKIIPSGWSATGEWFTPWELVTEGHGSPQTAPLLAQWRALTDAYTQGAHQAGREAAQAIEAQSYAIAPVSPRMIRLELLANRLALTERVVLLYAAVFVLALLVCRQRAVHQHEHDNTKIAPPLRGSSRDRVAGEDRGVGGRFSLFRFTRLLLLLTLCLHTAAIAVRVILLGRPPVSSLYESILFVAFISALYGLWLAWRKRMPEGLLIGSGIGALLLAVSGIYAEGDTLSMPVAVLNTNFWLATHVLCITAGYGCALMAGTLGHIALVAPEGRAAWMLTRTAAVALLFTAIGTVLGGIWADQSWGRFWGWDPKENGALLIVLWLVWLLHGRRTGWLGEAGFSSLLALTNIIVALSWFGVNLLNVGLHSYGFTREAATGLAVFCGMEIMVIFGLYMRARWQKGMWAS